MSLENTAYAFQNAAITGVGLNQFFLEPRFTTFRITGNVSQRWIPTGERSGLLTRIAAMESVSLCVRMKS